MNRQLGREDLDKKEASSLPESYDITSALDALRPNRNQHNDWSKVKGRSIHEPDIDYELGNERNELIVEPNLNTQFKRIQQTPDWGKVANQRGNVDESKIIEEEIGVTEGEVDAHTYIYSCRHMLIHTCTYIHMLIHTYTHT